MKHSARILFLAAAFASALSCGRAKPVARVSVSPNPIVLAYPQCATIDFDWRPLRPLDRLRGKPLVFVHLLDGPHHLVRTADHALPAEWKPNVPMKYAITMCQSALAPALRPGTYQLKIGLYDDQLGYRWPLETGGEETGRRGYRVAKVSVPRDAPTPAFAFAGSWLPTETVESHQILARRWFAGSASMSIANIRGPGAIHLELHLPQGATLASDCAVPRERLLLPGDQTLDLRVESAPTGGRCTIQWMPADGNAKSRGRLDVAAWLPASVVSQVGYF